MATPTICDRCGMRFDGTLDKQAQRYMLTLDVAHLGGRAERYEIDLCEQHMTECVAEFVSAPFMEEQIEKAVVKAKP